MSIAVQQTSASFANSEGWSDPPSRKRREPLIGGAIPFVKGSTVRRSPPMTPPISGHARRRHFSASNLAPNAKKQSPAATPDSWRARKCHDGRPAFIATYALAE